MWTIVLFDANHAIHDESRRGNALTKHAAIVGAGIMGLLTARELLSLGWRVTLYEKLPQLDYRRSTSFAAGGMLAPFSELESADELIFRLGIRSLDL